MNKRESELISSEIAQVIVNSAPVVEYTEADVKTFETSERMKYEVQGDAEHYYVIKQFCKMLNLEAVADAEYIGKFFKESRKLSAKEFFHDPFINEISVPNVKIGDFTLLNSFYDKGELFQYDMPDLYSDIVVPKIGFFDAPVSFPSIYEGNMPWMSVCPSEINSMKPQMAAAHGNVLVLGLGLGYYPLVISKRDNVEAVTIVERQSEIIRIFEDYILPQFSHAHKIKIVEADAYDYLDGVRDGDFDFCFADIWEGQRDGASAYVKIKKYDDAMPNTEFTYWIEKEIKWYLENVRDA